MRFAGVFLLVAWRSSEGTRRRLALQRRHVGNGGVGLDAPRLARRQRQ